MNQPSDTIAEKALIGSCLIDSSVFFRSNVNANDFYDDRHKTIWKAIGSILQSGNCDYVNLTNYLKAHNSGIDNSYVTEMITAAPSSLNAESYADIVLDRADRRRGLIAAGDIATACADQSRPLDLTPYIDKALRTSRFTGRRTNQENLSAWHDWYSNNLANPGKLSGLSTGINLLDKMTDGLELGTTTLLSGKPGLGKSMLTAQIALSIARFKHQVVIYSLEISDIMILNRWISVITEIPAYKIKRGEINADEQVKIAEAMEQLTKLPIHVVYDDQLTTSNIRSDLMRRQSMGQKADLIVVDYSGRLKDTLEKGEDELDRQAKCIGRIRSIGARMSCAIILVHTLNKEGDIAGRIGAQYDVDNILSFYQTKNTPDTPEGKRCVTLETIKMRDQNTVSVGSEVRLIRKENAPWFEELQETPRRELWMRPASKDYSV